MKDLVKNHPQIAERFAVAHNWIEEGHKARIVLRAAGLSRSTYYYGRSHRDRPRGRSGGGRPIPGYSGTKAGRVVSDDEVKEWICELIHRFEQEGQCLLVLENNSVPSMAITIHPTQEPADQQSKSIDR